ncbi:MAG: hypothetical protein ACMUIG_01330, partial [Thermoplasmatota archaeon]
MRKRIISLLLSVFLISIIFPALSQTGISSIDTADAVQTSVNPIVIEGNTELANHPLVSGSGTAGDPYLISDVSIDCRSSGRGGIAIRNTTRNFLIRNVTVYASGSAPGIFIRGRFTGSYYYPMYGVLDNITVIGGSTHIYLERVRSLTVKNSNFSNPYGSGNVVYIDYGYELFFTNNSFDAPYQWFSTNYPYYMYFRQNNGKLYGYYSNYFRYSDLANNTMITTRWQVYSGYASNIQGNHLTSLNSGQDLLLISDCNRIKIANNTFRGGKNAIYVEHPNTYSPPYTYYWTTTNLRFEYNTIEESETGIYFHYATGHAVIRYLVVHKNIFRNCSSYAISLLAGGQLTTTVWHNWFYSNNGASDVYSLSNAQCQDRYAQFSWSRDDLGNYWSDKNQPDENSDGFLDDSPYDLASNRNAGDFFPVSNPYYDFEKPSIDILTPRGRFVDNSYVNISWHAYDNISGLKMIQIREGYNEWMNVTGRDHHPVFINKGLHRIEVRAVDEALLKRTAWAEIFLNETRSPITITNPSDGEFLDSTSVDIDWTFGEGFVPFNMTLAVDERDPVIIDPFKTYSVGVLEGIHTFKLTSWDHYGNKVSQSVEATVDTTAPSLNVLYPTSGAVISNKEVHFKWEAQDASGIAQRRMKIDGNPFQVVEGDEFSILLTNGPHTFTLIVEDNTGWTQERAIAFTISRNTSLHITGPIYNNPTRNRIHEISWEYTSHFDVEKLNVILDQKTSISIGSSLTSYTVEFTAEGKHVVEVIGEDPVGNTVSDHIEIIVDNTPPRPQSKNLMDNQYLNRSEYLLRWGAVENYGIKHYALQLNGATLADDLPSGEYLLDLPEGSHAITMIAVDLAGNTGTGTIHVTVDLTSPDLELISPTGYIYRETFLTFKWRGEDANGISSYHYILDSGEMENMDTDTSKSLSLDQGKHTITIICEDNAGNRKEIIKELIIDPAPPTVSFIGEIGDHINYRSVLIRWSAYDQIGLSNLTLTVNSDVYYMSVNSSEFRVNLDHGRYEVSILAVDRAGWSTLDEMTFEIDLIPPSIVKTSEAVVSGRDVTVYWTIQNESLENLKYTLLIDGNISFIPVKLGSGSIMITEMDPGDHSIELIINDSAGNQGGVQWSFEVKEESTSMIDESGSGIAVVVLIVLLFLIAAVAAGWIVYRRSGRDEKKTELRLPSRPEKLKIGGAPPLAGALSPAKPAAPEVHKGAEDSSHSYIKPKTREKRPEQRITASSKKTHVHHPGDRTQRIHSRDSHSHPPKVHIPDIDIAGDSSEPADESIDTWDDAEEIDTWDELEMNFRDCGFEGRADSVRNFVSTWWHWDGSGD